jgi:hypothetical protein
MPEQVEVNKFDSAFPRNSLHPAMDGLSKRELFAALAQQGILAGGFLQLFTSGKVDPLAGARVEALIAEQSVKMADRLIEALNA